jgi:hypothetical protein
MAEPKLNILDAIKLMKYAPLVLHIVGAVQATMGDSPGPEKLAAAKHGLAAALALTEGLTEKDLVNDDAFMDLAGELIELGVTLMKLQPKVEQIAAHIRALKPPVV